MTEEFDVVDEFDRVIGRALRSECHGNPELIHRAVHVLVFNLNGELLLQKRSADKDIQPNRWDTSVGGHLDPGEDYLVAAQREAAEELGLYGLSLFPLYDSKIRNQVESENIRTFLTVRNSIGDYCRGEISDVRWWSDDAIESALGAEVFTPNFEEEWQAWTQWRRENPAPLESYLSD